MKALVVDDAPSRMALAELLSAYGVFELVEAADAADALNLLDGGLDPAICFCDAGAAGAVLLERMRGAGAAEAMSLVPLVLLSAAPEYATVVQALELGALGYLIKPLRGAQARASVDKILHQTQDKLAEDPAAAMRRLNIGTDRLCAYLDAFGEQLAAVRAELGPMLGDADGARLRVDALHTGCMTLGLWQAAAQLDLAREGALDARRLDHALVVAADAVLRQARRVRACAARHPSWTLAQP